MAPDEETQDVLSLVVATVAGAATCTPNHVCDLNGDGKLCNDDLIQYTSLIYNYDNLR